MAAEDQRGTDEQDPTRFDPWSGHHFGGTRFFAASTVIHVLLLVVLGTLSFTVFKTLEKINVKIVDEVGLEETDGEPSLEDYAGLLEVAKAPTRQAQRCRAISPSWSSMMSRFEGTAG